MGSFLEISTANTHSQLSKNVAHRASMTTDKLPYVADDGDTPSTLNSRPMRNTNDVTSNEPCCSPYKTLPFPQGLYTE